jgi:FeS assembly SUF system protein
MSEINKQELEEKVINALKTCYDPEIPVDIFELGLIYEIRIDEEANVTILMTLTSPACPVAGSLPGEVQSKVNAVSGIKSVKVELVWNPPWEKDMMSEVAKVELGFM